MASRQAREDRAEEAARVAVSELSDINRERYKEEGKRESEHEKQQQQKSSGVLGTIQESTKSILKAVTGTGGNKTHHDAASETREGADAASEKAGEIKNAAGYKAEATKESVADKAKEAKDYAAEKAKQGKDATAEKMGEYKDSAGEKMKEGKDDTSGKFSELKDSAADAARRAMEFLTGKKEEAKQKTSETGEAAKEKLSEAEEEARRKMEEMKIKGQESKDEAGQKAQETKDTEAERGSAAKSSILSSIGNVTGAIKEKLTHPSEAVDETGAAREQGGTGRKAVDVEQTPTGTAASTLKASDQMSGQTFNDVGRMGDEGVARADRSGKM